MYIIVSCNLNILNIFNKKNTKMAYYSKTSDVHHIYKKCTVGNNIEKDNLKNGTGGKRLCNNCKEIKEGNRSR